MNKLLKFSLKIQGKGVEELVFCEVKYHSDTISSYQIDKYESILEKIFQQIVKEFSQKPNLCKFEIKENQIESPLNDIEKALENDLNLAEFTLNHEDIKFKFSNELEYPRYISDTMERYFTAYYASLCGAERKRRLSQVAIPEEDTELQNFNSLLNDFEKLVDKACESFIMGQKLLKDSELIMEQIEKLKDEYNF